MFGKSKKADELCEEILASYSPNAHRYYEGMIAALRSFQSISDVQHAALVNALSFAEKQHEFIEFKIDLNSEDVPFMLNALVSRLNEIGENYQRSYAEDVEISALKRVARQLGAEVEMMDVINGKQPNAFRVASRGIE